LLSAPAGAGKTSLLAAWVAGLDRPVAWLTLDERDQDADQVLRYLVAALQTIAPACGRGALALLEVPRPPPPEVTVTSLLNDLVALPAPGLLVLDDYHLVYAPDVHAAVAFLLDHLPPTLHLVIASREDPPLPLPRLRARRQLAEVRAADLGFDVEEAVAMLGAGMGLRLAEAQVAALVERTEGWVAGLQLAGLALRDRPDPAAFVAAFTGGHRLVADYLLAEVLDRQPPSTRRFLLATGVLDRLCAPLCDAVAAPGADGDSQEILEELERANLFLVPLDDERVWYRYHHLFADALRARLAREAGPDAAAALHRRAGAWFGREGLLPEAIHHALAAGATEDAARWIEALTPTLISRSAIHGSLEQWLASLPESVVRARPLLCLQRAMLLGYRFQMEAAATWVEAARQALPTAADGPPNAETRRWRGAVTATRAYLATAGPAPAPAQALAWVEEALADLPADEVAYRSLAHHALGQAALVQGQVDRAEQAFAAAAAIGRAAGIVHGTLVATVQQVGLQRVGGARRQALATARAALDWAGAHTEPGTPGVGMLSVLLADLLRDGNALAAALPLATEGLHAVRQYGDAPPIALVASLSLARLRLAEGEPAGAATVLAEARPLIQDGPFVVLAPLLDAVEAEVLTAQNDRAAAVDWATTAAAPDPAPAARFGGVIFTAGIEALGVTAARILLVQGRATGDTAVLRQAERHLEAAWRLAEGHGLGWLRLRVLILRALLADALGDREAALGSLAAAVAQAEPEGVIRPFLDEGEPMAALLADLRAAARDGREPTGGVSPASLDTLLAAFPDQEPGSQRTGLVEPLTEREQEVLRLLAAGRSNAEMAAELFVEQSTVKTHLIHLYRKLGAHSRTQTVARAHALGLLD
jgi:LuxR family maltose regulon positive regulatory protein